MVQSFIGQASVIFSCPVSLGVGSWKPFFDLFFLLSIISNCPSPEGPCLSSQEWIVATGQNDLVQFLLFCSSAMTQLKRKKDFRFFLLHLLSNLKFLYVDKQYKSVNRQCRHRQPRVADRQCGHKNQHDMVTVTCCVHDLSIEYTSSYMKQIKNILFKFFFFTK